MSILSSPAKTKMEVIQGIAPFLHTDTICYRQAKPASTSVGEEYALWDRIINEIIKYDPDRNAVLAELNVTTGISAIKQSDSIVKRLLNLLSEEMDHEQLAAFESLTINLKSVLIPWVLFYKTISLEEGIQAALLESHSQQKLWGTLDDGHRLQEATLAKKAACAYMFLI